MKTIYLKVEVPEGFVIPAKIVLAPVNDNSRDAMIAVKWMEIHIPTEEEIHANADEWHHNKWNEFAGTNFEAGANWLKSKIEQQ